MSRVTIKQVIDFYDTHREYFANYITKDLHADLVMNSEFTPAELLDKWNATISRGHHIGLHEAKFKQYYPDVDFAKRHEIGQAISEIINVSESEEEIPESTVTPIEQVIKEEAAKFNADLEAKQELVNEINYKAELAQ